MSEQLLQHVRLLRAGLTEAWRVLAAGCSSNGRFEASLIDKHQIAAYELAFASAEMLAADVALTDHPAEEGTAGDLEQVYAAWAIGSVRERIDRIGGELGEAESPLRHAFDASALRTLRRAILAPDALDRIGAELIESEGRACAVRLDDAKELVRDGFARFAREYVGARASAIHREDLMIPEQILAPMRDMGVFGLAVPERYGGSSPNEGEDFLSMIVATEVLSAASVGAAGSLITRPEILTRALLKGGTEDQRQRWLPGIAQGNPLCAIAITEPDYGSDVASIQLKARRATSGWRLDGAKTWCTFAGKAQLLFVLARTDAGVTGYKGLSAFLVEKAGFDGHNFDFRQETGGSLEGRAIRTIGYRGMHSFDLRFDDFLVPDTHVIGGEAGLGQGFYFTMAGLTGGRIQTAARALGVMQAALLDALRYSESRRVFGASLSSFQLTRGKLTLLAARLLACRRLTYWVGRRLDEGGGQMEASLVKLFACRSAEWVTREALQIFGGLGYAEETSVSRYFVDARVLSIFEGAEETLALKVVARELMLRALGPE